MDELQQLKATVVDQAREIARLRGAVPEGTPEGGDVMDVRCVDVDGSTYTPRELRSILKKTRQDLASTEADEALERSRREDAEAEIEGVRAAQRVGRRGGGRQPEAASQDPVAELAQCRSQQQEQRARGDEFKRRWRQAEQNAYDLGQILEDTHEVVGGRIVEVRPTPEEGAARYAVVHVVDVGGFEEPDRMQSCIDRMFLRLEDYADTGRRIEMAERLKGAERCSVETKVVRVDPRVLKEET